MRAGFLAFMVSVAVLAQTPVLEVEGKDLPVVTGPRVSHNLPDLVSPAGNSRIDLQIRHSARRALTVPAVAVPAGPAVAIAHDVSGPAGWQAYKVEAAPGEKVKARLRGDHEAWFRVRCVNSVGQLEPGMLQNRIHTGNPEASYITAGKAPVTVYFVVDTTEILLGKEPYVLTLTREPAAGPAK